jgi:hypothetical protein
MSFDTSGIWGIVTIVGPILLAGAIIWAMLNNRGTKREVERTEEATKRLYDEPDPDEVARDR